MDLSFYKGKKVLITGHTGFKGSWMCKELTMLGSKVAGYSLPVTEENRLFKLSGMDKEVTTYEGDIRDLDSLMKVFDKEQPEIVIHMAAQPLVRESYDKPVYTYDVNVMGTVNVLECVRTHSCVKSFVNVTTDKVYKNKEWEWGYRENEELNGYDPYSNSKSCSELVTQSYVKSFFCDLATAVSTARAGNVIGGGDFATDRIIPDCVRSVTAGKPVQLRNPNSTRPYQHVLEPVTAYLLIAMLQYTDRSIAGNYNVGPDEKDSLTTKELAVLFCEEWEKQAGTEAKWESLDDKGPHEANYLKLDCSHIKNKLNWKPNWDAKKAVEKTVEWYLMWNKGKDVTDVMRAQIADYLSL